MLVDLSRYQTQVQDVQRSDSHKQSADRRPPRPSRTDEAADWLQQLMESRGRRVPAREVGALVRTHGIPIRFVKYAKVRLGIRSVQVGFHGGWLWVLPDEVGPGEKYQQRHRQLRYARRDEAEQRQATRQQRREINRFYHEHEQDVRRADRILSGEYAQNGWL